MLAILAEEIEKVASSETNSLLNLELYSTSTEYFNHLIDSGIVNPGLFHGDEPHQPLDEPLRRENNPWSIVWLDKQNLDSEIEMAPFLISRNFSIAQTNLEEGIFFKDSIVVISKSASGLIIRKPEITNFVASLRSSGTVHELRP